LKNNKIIIQKLKWQAGFSYIEMLVVLLVASALAVNQIKTTSLESTDMIANGMVEKIQRVQRASMRFYQDQNPNAWPLDAGTLVSMGYLTSGEELDSFGNTFVIGLDGQDLSVSTDVKDQMYVSRVQGRLPRSSSSGTTVTTLIDRPGYEVAHDALYSLDGSKPLTGPMDANGQNITNAGTVNATSLIDGATGYYIDPASISKLNTVEINSLTLVANATVGGSCTTKSLGTTSTGKFVACENGTWKTPSNELPVGSIYIATTTTDPSSTLGYGTWTTFGAGRVLVGQNTSDGSFDSMEEAGGSKTNTLSVAQLPAHRHFILSNQTVSPNNHSSNVTSANQMSKGTGATTSYEGYNTRASSSDASVGRTSSVGSTSATNNLQPYIVVKMWKRTG
jgi:microcystin-dependent protein/competence protein ComGC